RRWPSAGELARALEGCREGGTPLVPRADDRPRGVAAPRRQAPRLAIAIAILGAGAVLVGAGIGAFWPTDRRPSPPAPTIATIDAEKPASVAPLATTSQTA